MFVLVCSRSQTASNGVKVREVSHLLISFISWELQAPLRSIRVPRTELRCILRCWAEGQRRIVILSFWANPLSVWYFGAEPPSCWFPAVRPVGSGFSATPREQPSARLYFSWCGEWHHAPPRRLKLKKTPICVGPLTFITWHIDIWYIIDFKIWYTCMILFFKSRFTCFVRLFVVLRE